MTIKSHSLNVKSFSIDVLDAVRDSLKNQAQEDMDHALELAVPEIQSFITRLCIELDHEYCPSSLTSDRLS